MDGRVWPLKEEGIGSVNDDDGFGPVQRGGGSSSRGVDLNPRPRPTSPIQTHRRHPPEDGFAPAERGRHNRVRAAKPRRLLRLVLLGLLALLVVALSTGLAAAVVANNKITRVDVGGLEPVTGGRRNILLVGSDDRTQLTKAQRRRLGTGNFDGERTDTILVLSLEGSRGALLSFPRDLFVTRCDGSQGRINAAYSIGGPACLVETISEVSGIPITNFLEVDFLGFHDIVQAVGGVRMCLKEPISDDDAHIDLPKGCQRLNGKEALGFVRVRKIDNDLGRIERQQRFMKALAVQVAQPSTVLNPVTLFSTANAVGSALTADAGLGISDLAALARGGAAMGRTEFPQYAVPAANAYVGGASVLTIIDQEAQPLFASFRDGSVLRPVGGDVTPEQVSLEVRNGAGVPGLAGAAAQELEARGFTVTKIGNAASVERSVVRYTAGNEDQARLVAAQSPSGAVDIKLIPKGPPVVLVLGRDAADSAR